ncbi:YdaU family protein [Hymenobacter latericus]|uniref:YdaU family protein n=1 Tax=Hymenobacter sp. YIM 151858-1 TaxID=2987688 RepID=UPI0022266C8D|nr:YdaU family protein [Hymenobacter sp. YIM 151858-1]UYZ60156.1 YdaU family protein [Hymenobacter sp. YIM 151858-1]
MKAPAFQFYPADFLASPDVQIMETYEVGAYMLLLCAAWQSERPGYLANDEGRLRRLARLTAEQWKESSAILLRKFPVVEGGEYRANRRMLHELEKQQSFRESRAEAGRASAAKRAKRQQEVNENPTRVENPATRVEEKANIDPTLLSTSSSTEEVSKPLGESEGEDRSADASLAKEVVAKIEAAKTVAELKVIWEQHRDMQTSTGFRQTMSARRQAVEAAAGKKKPEPPAPSKRTIAPEPGLEFEAFWKLYPRSEKKAAALKLWNTKLSNNDRRQVLEGLPDWVAKQDREYVPHPTTFLNGKRWLDDGYGSNPEKQATLMTVHRNDEKPRKAWTREDVDNLWAPKAANS